MSMNPEDMTLETAMQELRVIAAFVMDEEYSARILVVVAFLELYGNALTEGFAGIESILYGERK